MLTFFAMCALDLVCERNLERARNNWIRYMVALSGGRTTRPLEVGGKGDLSDTSTIISEGVIEVTGLSFGPGDSMCCPSVPKTKEFRISPSGLSQIVRPPQ